MTRITELQLSRSLVGYLGDNRNVISKLNDDIASGISVRNPGDSINAGSIAQFQQNMERAKGFENRIASTQSYLEFQENVLTQANDLLIRAKEIATQAANETVSAENRRQMAEEVFQIRDHLVSLANSTYQGRFVFGGNDEDDPPYDPATYTNPASGDASVRYVYDTDPGATQSRTINITESLQLRLNTPGNQLFDSAVQGLERLGRAMAGFETLPATGAPDGTGVAYTFPDQYGVQSQAIRDSINLLDTAREQNIMPERVDLAGRMRRLETAESLLSLTKDSAKEALDQYQSTDMISAATQLSQAQTSLQASLTVSTRVLQLSILDYI